MLGIDNRFVAHYGVIKYIEYDILKELVVVAVPYYDMTVSF